MFIQFSIDDMIGTGTAAGYPMPSGRFAAFTDAALDLIQEFIDSWGWVDPTVEIHDMWPAALAGSALSRKIAAYAAGNFWEDPVKVAGRMAADDLVERLASLAWRFDQESIHLVLDVGTLFGSHRVELVYGDNAPEAQRREVYIEKQGGFDPWAVAPDEPEVMFEPIEITPDMVERAKSFARTLLSLPESFEDGFQIVRGSE